MPLEQTLQLERVPGVNNNGGQLLYIFAIYITTNKRQREKEKHNHNKHRTQIFKILNQV